MLESGTTADDLPLKVWRGTQISDDVLRSIDAEEVIRLGGIYGDRNAGDPIEYDHLRLILTDDVIEIEVFNRGIMLFTTDDDKIRRLHRVLCKLDRG